MNQNCKKSILFVNGHLKIGGVEKTLVDLLLAIDSSRFDVDLLLLQGAGDYVHLLPKEVRVISFDTREAYGPLLGSIIKCLKSRNIKLLLFRLIYSLSSLMGAWFLRFLSPILPIRHSYDYAIAYRHGFCADVVVYSTKASKKICWWHNGEYNLSSKEEKRTLRVWKFFSKIITVSTNCQKILIQKFPEISDRFIVLHNILDVESININSDPTPQEYSPDIPNFVSVGRLSPIKHFDNVVTVAKLLIDGGYTHFKWFIVGAGCEEKNIITQINHNYLSRHVILVGSKINPYPYIKHADLLIHPSYFEAHCTTILEAMALKTPCVVTKTVIPQDYTENHINCLEVDRDPNSLYEGVLTMIQNPDKAKTMASVAYKQVCDRYNPSLIVKCFYSAILSD